MEEIFLDLSQVPMSQEDLASLEEIISKVKDKWTSNRYSME